MARRRQAGFYVAFATSVLGGRAPELLDGPWASRDAALERAREIEAEGRGSWRIVFVDRDGITHEEPD